MPPGEITVAAEQATVDEIMDRHAGMVTDFVMSGRIPPRPYLATLAAHACYGITQAPEPAEVLEEFIANVRETYRKMTT